MLNKIKQWVKEYIRVVIGGHIIILGVVLIIISLHFIFVNNYTIKYYNLYNKNIELIDKMGEEFIKNGCKKTKGVEEFEKKYDVYVFGNRVTDKRITDEWGIEGKECNGMVIIYNNDLPDEYEFNYEDYFYILYVKGFFMGKNKLWIDDTHHIVKNINNNVGIIYVDQ